jgi:hypothetical protein
MEALLSAFEQNADQIDNDGAAAHNGPNRVPMIEVCLHRMNLTSPFPQLQMAGVVGMTRRDPDSIATFCQCTYGMTAKESRAAEDRHQSVGTGSCRHGRLTALPPIFTREPVGQQP